MNQLSRRVCGISPWKFSRFKKPSPLWSKSNASSVWARDWSRWPAEASNHYNPIVLCILKVYSRAVRFFSLPFLLSGLARSANVCSLLQAALQNQFCHCVCFQHPGCWFVALIGSQSRQSTVCNLNLSWNPRGKKPKTNRINRAEWEYHNFSFSCKTEEKCVTDTSLSQFN